MKHIYVHVPFCRRRCSYCDFSIAVRKAIPAKSFVDSILKEIEMRVEAGEWDDAETETLYLGGGTPSLLPGDAVAELVESLPCCTTNEGTRERGNEGTTETATQLPPAPCSPIPAPEITLEANPDDVTVESVSVWKSAGVNRVSLGVQSFDPGVLKWMRRTHTADASVAAMEALREAGIENVSIDLIFGLPEQLDTRFEADLERGLELEPEHISVYGLTVERSSPLGHWVAQGTIRSPQDSRYEKEFLLADAKLTAAGYAHYEVSNYSRPGRESLHNSAYWSGASYGGLGPSAHRYRAQARERAWNVRPWAEYERLVSGATDPTAEREQIDADKEWLEAIYLGLRTCAGVNLSWLGDGEETWGRLVEDSLARQDRGRLLLTVSGWLKLDEITVALTT
ncbi:MAG: coproporphyrinogen-III oxidase family protein [Gemmatimonadetes bacterium]|nr:coproporphyrinogen-III oxidase family protein [Gemmatimonadota bacterium]